MDYDIVIYSQYNRLIVGMFINFGKKGTCPVFPFIGTCLTVRYCECMTTFTIQGYGLFFSAWP